MELGKEVVRYGQEPERNMSYRHYLFIRLWSKYDYYFRNITNSEKTNLSPGSSCDNLTDVENKINEWRDIKNRIVLTGQSGMGKSTMANTLLGKEVMPVGKKIDPGTIMTLFDVSELEPNMVVYDTPSLRSSDGNQEDYVMDRRWTVEAIEVVNSVALCIGE